MVICEICCVCLRCKLFENHRVMLIFTLLLVAAVCAIAGLYHGLTVREYSGLSIVLGIWLPSLLLAMITIYVTIIYVQKCQNSDNHSPCHSNYDGTSLEFEMQQNYRMNFGYQPDVDTTFIDDDITETKLSSERSCEISRVNVMPKTHGNKISRSRSSSDLAVHYNRRIESENLESIPRRTDHSQYASAMMNSKSRQKAPRELRRSLSESRSHRNKKDGSHTPVGNIVNSDLYKYYSSDEQGPIDCNFYQRQDRRPSSSKQYNEFHREGARTFAPDRQDSSDCTFSRIEQSNMQIGSIDYPVFYRKDKYFVPPDNLDRTRGQLHNRPIVHRDGKHSTSDEQGQRRCLLDSKSAERFSKMQIGNVNSSRRCFTDELLKYPSPGYQELSDRQSYDRKMHGQPTMKQCSDDHRERGFKECEREFISHGSIEENKQRMIRSNFGVLDSLQKHKRQATHQKIDPFSSDATIFHHPERRKAIDQLPGHFYR